MQSSLIVPPEWLEHEVAADSQKNPDEGAENSPSSARVLTQGDYATLSIFNHESGAIVSALPSLEFMSTRVKYWMPTLLEVLGRCDIDPALYPTILHVREDDWQAWQQGTLETVSIDTAVCSRLLWEILSLIYCFVGSWDHVAGWLNHNECWKLFNNRCPLRVIKSGDIAAIASLQRVLAGEVLGAGYD